MSPLLSTITSAIIMVCSSQSMSYGSNQPPPYPEVALMARYIMHHSSWLSIATISTYKGIEGYAFVTLKSLSDGPMDNSTGIPYLFMTDMDVSGKDISKNNNVTIMTTLAQTNYCTKKDIDPQDPRCTKVIISGRVIKVENGTEEYDFAKESLFERHPAMRNWPSGHDFYVAKMDLEKIFVLDYYGGIKTVPLENYFSANITHILNREKTEVIAVKGNI